MSYEIFYQKQFIKAEKNGTTVYIPMVEGGSNNCYEVGRGGKSGRRSRDWANMSHILGGAYYGTLEQMLAKTEEVRQGIIDRNKEYGEKYPEHHDEYNDKSFGWFASLAIGGNTTSKTSFGMYQGLFKTGCAKALTVEELRENFGITVRLYVSVWSEEKEAFKALGKEEFVLMPTTSEELIQMIDEKVEYLRGTKQRLSITLWGSDYNFKRIRTDFKIKKRKESSTTMQYVEVPFYFVLQGTKTNGFFIKNTRNGYKYTSFASSAKKFTTEDAAAKYISKVNSTGGEWRVQRIISPANIKMRVKKSLTAPIEQY